MKKIQIVLHNRFMDEVGRFDLTVAGTQYNVIATDPQTGETKATAWAAERDVDHAGIDLLHALGFDFTMENHLAVTNAMVQLIAAAGGAS